MSDAHARSLHLVKSDEAEEWDFMQDLIEAKQADDNPGQASGEDADSEYGLRSVKIRQNGQVKDCSLTEELRKYTRSKSIPSHLEYQFINRVDNLSRSYSELKKRLDAKKPKFVILDEIGKFFNHYRDILLTIKGVIVTSSLVSNCMSILDLIRELQQI